MTSQNEADEKLHYKNTDSNMNMADSACQTGQVA